MITRRDLCVAALAAGVTATGFLAPWNDLRDYLLPASDGSGLGLSIANSLMELMGGKLTLTLDGDLFKAALVFPQKTV